MISKRGFILPVLVLGALAIGVRVVTGPPVPNDARGLNGAGTVSTPKPVAYESLKLPPSPQAAGRYALQAGLFIDPAAAASLVETARGLGLSVRSIAVVDERGTRWVVVALGEFDDVDSARLSGADLPAELGLGGMLSVIVLPAP